MSVASQFFGGSVGSGSTVIFGVEVFVVGGGSGGEADAAGEGGGGGGVLYQRTNVVVGKSYTITVGAGGNGGSNPGVGNRTFSTPGSNSSFGSNISYGGGFTQGGSTPGFSTPAPAPPYPAPAGTTGFSFPTFVSRITPSISDGFYGVGIGNSNLGAPSYAAGGGGGAGGPFTAPGGGFPGGSPFGGGRMNGNFGLKIDITGTLTGYGGGGGGGGGAPPIGGGAPGIGTDGGGNGGAWTGSGSNATANTGGGGGGGSGNGVSGGSGGSGMVFIRYPTSFAAATVSGNTPTPAQPGYNVYRWNSGPGTITFN